MSVQIKNINKIRNIGYISGGLMNQNRFAAAGHTTAPTYQRQAVNDIELGTTTTVTVTINAGDTVVVTVAAFDATVGVTSVVGGSTYTLLDSRVNVEDSRMQTFVYGVLADSAASSVVVTLNEAVNHNVAVVVFTGVGAFGNTTDAGNAVADYDDTTHTATVTMQDNNNVILHCGANRGPAAGTATVGTERSDFLGSNQGSVGVYVGSNTSASSGSLSMTYTTGAGVLWDAVGIELRSP